jgi:hypothetical protein
MAGKALSVDKGQVHTRLKAQSLTPETIGRITIMLTYVADYSKSGLDLAEGIAKKDYGKAASGGFGATSAASTYSGLKYSGMALGEMSKTLTMAQTFESAGKLTSSGALASPGKLSIVITATLLDKALLAAGVTTQAEANECLLAVAQLSVDVALTPVEAVSWVGVPLAVITALGAVKDGWDVGNKCFKRQVGNKGTEVVSHVGPH